MAKRHSRKSWWVVTEVDGRLAVVDKRVELARAGLC